MAMKEDGEWIFTKQEVDNIFEKAINRKLKKTGSLSEQQIIEIGRELDVDLTSLQRAILDVKSEVGVDVLLNTTLKDRMKTPGGTPGGLKHFFIGVLMAISGGYMLTNQIQVRGSMGGYRFGFGGVQVSAFGATLIPLLLGIGMLFFNGRSKIGWLLTGGSLIAIIVGVLTNLQVYFQPTSLYVTMIMLTLLVGGIGLIIRSLRSS